MVALGGLGIWPTMVDTIGIKNNWFHNWKNLTIFLHDLFIFSFFIETASVVLGASGPYVTLCALQHHWLG